MPFVNIKITPDGATPEKKAELIAGVTNLLRDTLGKNPATTVVIIEEVATVITSYSIHYTKLYDVPRRRRDVSDQAFGKGILPRGAAHDVNALGFGDR